MSDVVRGSMWWASIPHDSCNPHSQSGMRPVVVISNDKGNEHSPSILVCPITTKKDKYYFIHPHVRCANNTESYVLTEQIKVLDKELLGTYIGNVREIEQSYIDKALLISLGMIELVDKIKELEEANKLLVQEKEGLEKENSNIVEEKLKLHRELDKHLKHHDESAQNIGIHVKGIFEELFNANCIAASRPVDNNDEEIITHDAARPDQPAQPPRTTNQLSAIDKFNMRLAKSQAMQNKVSSSQSADTVQAKKVSNLRRPNARKWDSQTIRNFVADYTELSQADLLKKYDLNSLSTATKYYLKFKKSESL